MSAELLRKAVMILRERAEAATPGPWEVNEGGMGVLAGREEWDLGGGQQRILTANMPYRAERMRANVAHVATMHPGVGLALADWLEDEANAAGYHENRVVPAALPLARLIVGEQP